MSGLVAVESFADDRLDRHTRDEGAIITFSKEVPRVFHCLSVRMGAPYYNEHAPSVFSPT